MIVMVSGGFDPLHVGHLEMLEEAANMGIVVVALNSDDWLMRKKGYVFMPHMDRTRILKALSSVSDVTPVDDGDGTVCEALRRIRPGLFLNGGDRIEADPKEAAVCRELGIGQAFGIGGRKVRSSSELVRRIAS